MLRRCAVLTPARGAGRCGAGGGGDPRQRTGAELREAIRQDAAQGPQVAGWKCKTQACVWEVGSRGGWGKAAAGVGGPAKRLGVSGCDRRRSGELGKRSRVSEARCGACCEGVRTGRVQRDLAACGLARAPFPKGRRRGEEARGCTPRGRARSGRWAMGHLAAACQARRQGCGSAGRQQRGLAPHKALAADAWALLSQALVRRSSAQRWPAGWTCPRECCRRQGLGARPAPTCAAGANGFGCSEEAERSVGGWRARCHRCMKRRWLERSHIKGEW